MASQEWVLKLIENGGDASECRKLLKEINESQEKAAEREARKAERELEQASIEKEIRLKELEIKDKELALIAVYSKEKALKVVLPKFSEGHDIEVFLRSFEKLANSYGWEKTEWEIRLVPQLSGKALEAYARISVSASNDYKLTKQAILEHYGLVILLIETSLGMPNKIIRNLQGICHSCQNYFKHWVQVEKAENNYAKLYDLMMHA